MAFPVIGHMKAEYFGVEDPPFDFLQLTSLRIVSFKMLGVEWTTGKLSHHGLRVKQGSRLTFLDILITEEFINILHDFKSKNIVIINTISWASDDGFFQILNNLISFFLYQQFLL